jgi:predicted ribosomally synthesized peptide with nif11-like leader
MQTAAVIPDAPDGGRFPRNDHTTMSSTPRAGQDARRGQVPGQDARAFLARAELDEELAETMAEADGDMTRILAIAAEAGYTCTAQELVNAYDELVRSGPNAAIYDFGHPMVYLNLRAPSDLGHAAA